MNEEKLNLISKDIANVIIKHNLNIDDSLSVLAFSCSEIIKQLSSNQERLFFIKKINYALNKMNDYKDIE